MSAVLNTVTEQFLHSLQADFDKLQAAGESLFMQLAAIQITITGLYLALKGDFNTFIVKFVQVVVVLSVFYTAILFGGHWMPVIINSFIDIGANAAGITSLTPSSVIDQGFSIGSAMIDNFGSWGWVTHPFGALLAAILLIMIVILYALLAGELVVVLVKSYILVSLSGLAFAFGALEITRPIAMNYFKSVIGIGLQLLAIYLILGVGQQIGNDWAEMIKQAAANHELIPFLVVAATAVVYYLIIKNVPPFIAGLTGTSGFRSYGDAAVGAAMTASASTVNTLTRGGSFAGQAGGRLASAYHMGLQSLQAGGIGGAPEHLRKAMSGAIGQHFRGENRGATFGQRVNQNLHNAIKSSNSVAGQSSSGAPSSNSPGVSSTSQPPIKPANAPPRSGNVVKFTTPPKPPGPKP